jgi:hypothetical protein
MWWHRHCQLALEDLLRQLSVSFPVKDIGELSFSWHLSGLEFGGINLTQQKYAWDLLQRTTWQIADQSTPVCTHSKAVPWVRSSAAEWGRSIHIPQHCWSFAVPHPYAPRSVPVFGTSHIPIDVYWDVVKRITHSSHYYLSLIWIYLDTKIGLNTFILATSNSG